jgi:hypothetical protein
LPREKKAAGHFPDEEKNPGMARMGSPMKAGVSTIYPHLKSIQNKQQGLVHPDYKKSVLFYWTIQ